MIQQASISTQQQAKPVAITNEVLPIAKPLDEHLLKEPLQHLPIQRKLTVGAVNDPLEYEADAMADKVMRMPVDNFIQRKCQHCEEEEKAQRKPLESFIQRKCSHCEAEEKAQLKPLLPFIQQKGNVGIQRVVTESTASGTVPETASHADAHAQKKEKDPKCNTVKTQRWGCDTSCSRVGFMDTETPFTDEHGEFGKSSCCNKWPPFVESFARNHLSLNGVASCKGSMLLKTFKVKFNGTEIKIGCTDSTTTDADHELELSPLAAKDLFGSMEFPLNQKVQVCEDGMLTDVCKLDVSKLNNPRNPAFPRQVDCVEKGCKPQDNSVTCERYDWPKGS